MMMYRGWNIDTWRGYYYTEQTNVDVGYCTHDYRLGAHTFGDICKKIDEVEERKANAALLAALLAAQIMVGMIEEAGRA